MSTLTIETTYTHESPLPDSYIFSLRGMDESPETQRQLRRLAFRYDHVDKVWRKTRYAHCCNRRDRDAIVQKLRQIDPDLRVMGTKQGGDEWNSDNIQDL